MLRGLRIGLLYLTVITAIPAGLTAYASAQDSPTVAGIGATVPLGGVIAWFRFSARQPIPDGYWVADGSVVTDVRSPFNGMATPNLVDHFIMGVTPSRIGETGGRNDIPMDGNGTFAFSGTTNGAQAPGSNPDAWHHDGNRACCPQVTGLDHTHSFSGVVTIPPHNHGGDNRPAYVGLLYLVRIV